MVSSVSKLLGESDLKPKADKANGSDDDSTELDDELPSGFLQAVGELRAAESDEEAAAALIAAIRLVK